ncbi:GspE/PulE family protein [Patescibacteria group bacterium]
MENIENTKKISEIPSLDLTGKDIPVDVLKEIPEEAAIFYKFVPIVRQGNILKVGMVNPDDLKAKEALRFITQRSGLSPEIYTITEADFENILRQYRTLRGEVKKALKELEKELKSEEMKFGSSDAEKLAQRITTEAPITKIVAVILRHAVEGNASDIHIEPTDKKVKVRFRVDSILYASIFLPKEVHLAIISRIKILSSLKIDESRVPQDGRFQAIVSGKKIDFRVSTFPTINGEKAVLRVLDPSVGLKTFEDLGLQGRGLDMLSKNIKKPFGMILLTGPTGSGKTTTLYSILKEINKIREEGVNIISLEDPVEYYIEGVNQSQIRPEINYTFASGLRHILRQDPDVIMVGEIRDEETADLAIHTALTGHILLSTLHTNNAIGVIPRFIDMGVGSFLLPPTLNLAIAQRLVRRLCQKCRQEVDAPVEVSEIIERELETMRKTKAGKEIGKWKKPFKISHSKGCKFCNNKRFKGRIALFEMLEMTPRLEEIINKGATEALIKEEAQEQGMVNMKQDGIIKVLQGIISFEEMIKSVESD